ncbi:ATP-binding cassette domain-containing protein [Baaleninema sp.]|uniref:ATP-binding cassette domain-containing protein n=1 Tax=Baaleninema sp. TaxID=3101197 RepID=UPI003CFC5B94
MNQAEIVSIEHLDYYYQDANQRKQVLYDINLNIYPGEILILTGASGSGKTTLLSLIGCLRSIQSGSLKIFGHQLYRASEQKRMQLRRQIGYIFQHFNLWDFMTIRQNIQISLELQQHFSAKKARIQTDSILQEVGLSRHANAHPSELSGGQKQRVAIARALVHRPKLVLADEPTAALDSQTGREAMEIVRHLAKQEGSAVLIVTHDPRILDVADRIIRIEDGRLGTAYGEELSLVLPTLSDRELTQIASTLKVQTYAKGETIIQQGDIADKFFILIEGTVEVVQEQDNSEVVFLRTLSRNDYFGEIGIVNQSQRTATVCVISEEGAKVIVMERDIFMSMMSESDLTNIIIKHQVQERLYRKLIDLQA